MNLNTFPILFAVMAVWVVPTSASAKIVAEWDLSNGLQGWSRNSRVESPSSPPEGLIVRPTGQDPWIEGSAADLPGHKMVVPSLEKPEEPDRSEDKHVSAKSGTLEGRSEIQIK